MRVKLLHAPNSYGDTFTCHHSIIDLKHVPFFRFQMFSLFPKNVRLYEINTTAKVFIFRISTTSKKHTENKSYSSSFFLCWMVVNVTRTPQQKLNCQNYNWHKHTGFSKALLLEYVERFSETSRVSLEVSFGNSRPLPYDSDNHNKQKNFIVFKAFNFLYSVLLRQPAFGIRLLVA